MPKAIFRTLMLGLTAVLVVGCSSTKKSVEPVAQGEATKPGITVRGYTEDRPRVDQDMVGNFGYIFGQGEPEDRSDLKKTKRIYVLEVTKEVAEPVEVAEYQMKPVPDVEPTSLPEQEQPSEPAWRQPVQLPVIESSRPAAVSAGEPRFEEYVVQEGDTLQKISKKYYDSFAKWTRIYDANKDVMKDPNRIRAGMKLQIPLE